MRFFHRKEWTLDSEGGAWEGERKGGQKERKSNKPSWLSLMIRNFLADSNKKK